MKRILITGANSYIGTSFERYLQQWPDDYQVDTIDMVDGSWKQKSFANYDTIFHVAGIAHVKECKRNIDLYYRVNRDLAIETAQKAKSEGVSQFIFLSSMSVYGLEDGMISYETIPSPKSHYGKSKLQAEEVIVKYRSNEFCIAVLRPPMVYGKECKGNYSALSSLAIRLPIFPVIYNQRSMLYIENLCELVRIIVLECFDGFFWPQNSEYVKTSELVKQISENHGKPMFMFKGMQWVIKLFSKAKIVNKVFGSLIYSRELSDSSDYNYQIVQFKESIIRTEAK